MRSCFDNLKDALTGTLPFSALKKACRRMKWQGDVRLLFDCLDGGCGSNGEASSSTSRRFLHFKDISFLESWQVAMPDDVIREEEQAIMLTLKKKRGWSAGSRKTPGSPASS